MSPQQEQMWGEPRAASTAFRAQCSITLEGVLDGERLRTALGKLTQRHEILRTIFTRQSGMKVPFQVVLDACEPAWSTVDFSQASASRKTGQMQEPQVSELLAAEWAKPADLERGPVMHAVLARLADTSHLLVLTLPGACADTQSLRLLASELAALYGGKEQSLPEEPLRYVQFAQWQKDLIESDEENSVKAREFWKQQAELLEPVPILPLENKTGDTEFSVGVQPLEISRAAAEKIDNFASQWNNSASHLALAAWQVLLWRFSGQAKFATSVAYDGREYEELREAVGLLAKTIPVDTRFDGDFSFKDITEHAHQSVQKLMEWQEYFKPTEGNNNRAAYEHVTIPEGVASGGLTWTVDSVRAVWEPFALKLVCLQRAGSQSAGTWRCELQYDARRFAATDVARWAEHFQVLLAAALDAPATPVRRLPLLTVAQRQQLLSGWNPAPTAIPALCFHQLFEQQAARTPDRLAVVCDGVSLTYADCNARANQLAHHLRSLGVGPDSRVGLCLDRSVSLMVGLLAILKAGGAYVPLQSDHPPARLAQQLDGAAALLTEQKLLSALPAFSGPVLALDRDAASWASQPSSNPPLNTEPHHLAYVIFTSGSTGVPKGVAISHRNLVNYTAALCDKLQLARFPDGLRFATVSALNADLGNTCIFPALASGGTLHVLPYDVATDARRFAQYSAQHHIDVLKIVPSHLQALLSADQAAHVLPRQFLITGGESLTRPLVETILALNPTCQLINHYGPTETTIGSLTLPLRDYDWQHSRAATIPIGRPLPNTRVYVLDADLEPVPVGVPGELFLAGAGVARGYLQQPERTAERFLPDPFVAEQESTGSDARMYRTGDLARWLPEGLLEFLGRADDQVKVRGFRIELGEVEAALLEHALVRQAAVLVRQDSPNDTPNNDSQNGAPGEKRLVAYIVPTPGSQLSPDTLRAHLKTLLPDYMIPAAFVLLDKLPLTPNGKIDRQKLPAPESLALSKPFVAPSTPTELALAQIWQEVLRKPSISADDNFFDLGGHSLLATQVVSRVRERLNVEMALRSIFETPTIAGLAATLADFPVATSAETPTIARVSREGYRVTRG